MSQRLPIKFLPRCEHNGSLGKPHSLLPHRVILALNKSLQRSRILSLHEVIFSRQRCQNGLRRTLLSRLEGERGELSFRFGLGRMCDDGFLCDGDGLYYVTLYTVN